MAVLSCSSEGAVLSCSNLVELFLYAAVFLIFLSLLYDFLKNPFEIWESGNRVMKVLKNTMKIGRKNSSVLKNMQIQH